MDDLVREMIATLGEARDALRAELSPRRAERSPDAARLVELHTSVRSFVTQTDALLLITLERDLGGDIHEVAEELADFFEDAQEEIEAMLERRPD